MTNGTNGTTAILVARREPKVRVWVDRVRRGRVRARVDGVRRGRQRVVRPVRAAVVAAVDRLGRVRTRTALAADAGMATAEYAIATVAAVGFAGLLVAILRSNEVRGLLLGIIRGALTV